MDGSPKPVYCLIAGSAMTNRPWPTSWAWARRHFPCPLKIARHTCPVTNGKRLTTTNIFTPPLCSRTSSRTSGSTFAQQEYARRNPNGFKGYSDVCWGLTACEGPGPKELTIDGIKRVFFDYV